jgi:hypothetical protein
MSDGAPAADRGSGFGCEICFDDPPVEPVVT